MNMGEGWDGGSVQVCAARGPCISDFDLQIIVVFKTLSNRPHPNLPPLPGEGADVFIRDVLSIK